MAGAAKALFAAYGIEAVVFLVVVDLVSLGLALLARRLGVTTVAYRPWLLRLAWEPAQERAREHSD